MSRGLWPSDAPIGTVRADRQLPIAAREWGQIIDTRALCPGDLVLTQPVDPDGISKRIQEAQRKGGMSAADSAWTHAAVYLGDGENICEASFKEPGFRWGVNIRSIFDYCDRNFAIRVRRPANLTIEQRIGITVGALTRIGHGYNFNEILTFLKAARTGKGFWQAGARQRIDTKAVVCSTLYQDAYNFSFRGATVRLGSLCTPSHLSCSQDFDPIDPPIGWLTLV